MHLFWTMVPKDRFTAQQQMALTRLQDGPLTKGDLASVVKARGFHFRANEFVKNINRKLKGTEFEIVFDWNGDKTKPGKYFLRETQIAFDFVKRTRREAG